MDIGIALLNKEDLEALNFIEFRMTAFFIQPQACPLTQLHPQNKQRKKKRKDLFQVDMIRKDCCQTLILPSSVILPKVMDNIKYELKPLLVTSSYSISKASKQAVL